MDLNEMSALELMNLGCQRWDEEDTVYLLPVEVLKSAPEDTVLVDIFGKEMTKKEFAKEHETGELDYDTRFGCTAYGIRAKK